MSTTIDALLRLAELEQTLPISELKQIQVNDLVKDICRELENLAASKSVEFNIEINDSNLSFTAVEADAKAALLNVLRNAIVYSRDEQRVNIKASKVGKFVQFQIEDFGIGIEANDLPRIFDRFWRSDKARSYRSGGKGLGLAITKSIVDRYNGTIGVESMPGKGSCVTVRFPEMPQ
jgi:signal transduction histidine kinase